MPHTVSRCLRVTLLLLAVAGLDAGFGAGGARGARAAQAAEPAAGPYGVGFKVLQRYDHTRPYRAKRSYRGVANGGELSRPMQVAIWYPAQAGKGQPLRFRDYALLARTKDSFGEPSSEERAAELRRWRELLAERGGPGLDAAAAGAVLDAPRAARRGAPAARGPFPVLVYAPGGDSESFDNCTLFELLASHGYIVLSSHSLGPREPLMRIDVEGLETQIRDVEFLIGLSRELPQADAGRLGLLGNSWGGLAIIVEQMRNPNVDAVVSIDGSIKGFYALAKTVRGFDPGAVRAPFLLLSSREPEGELLYFDDLAYAPAYVIGFDHLEHLDTNCYGDLGRRAKAPAAVTAGDRARIEEYSLLCRAVLAFCDAYLRHLAPELTRLRSLRQEAGIRVARWKEAEQAPPTREEFTAILRQEGVAAAADLFHRFHAAAPGYVMFEEDHLANIGFEYFNGLHRNADGIRIMQLNLEAYPRSYKAHGFLARLYEKNGDGALALPLYREAYELGRQDPSAERHWVDYFKAGAERVATHER